MKPEVLDAIAHDIDECHCRHSSVVFRTAQSVRLGARAKLAMGHCPSFFKWADALRPAPEETDGL